MNESWVSEDEHNRRIEARRTREAAPGERRCAFCKRKFVPAPRSSGQRYCCDEHRKEHFCRRKVLPLQTLIVQGRRQEAAPRRCEWCEKPLPPPGKTGVLARYHKTCRELRCRARKRAEGKGEVA